VNLVITADDFGRSSEINRAVVLAHREGILTTASLMVAGEAAEEAVALAKENPTLAVGLHLVVVDGRAVLPPDQIPHLVDADNRFPNSPTRMGLKYAFNATARRELSLEIRAQFEKFGRTGLPLSHVDGHQHMHVHPAVFKILLPLAKQFGARGIRLPRDPDCFPRRFSWAIYFSLLSRWCARQIRHDQFATLERSYGLANTGQMTESYLVNLLNRRSMPDKTEIYFHPTTGQRLDQMGPNPEELKTLLSPSIKQLIQSRGIRLSTYATLCGS